MFQLKLKGFFFQSRFSRPLLLTALSALTSGCASLFYFPDPYLYFPPYRFGLDPEETYVTTPDGLRLQTWTFNPILPAPASDLHQPPHFFHPSAPPAGTVVQFHGNAQNLSSHYTSLVWLTRHNYQFITFSYRGYAQNAGNPSPEGTFTDAMALLEFAWQKHLASNPQGKFIVYGQSLGGNISLFALAQFEKTHAIDLIVLDSTFLSYKDMIQEVMGRFWILWPFQWIGRWTVSDRFAATSVIEQIRTPALILHDSQDPVVGFKNGQTLYDRYPAAKSFWELRQGRHVGVFSIGNEENKRKFITFLNETIRNP